MKQIDILGANRFAAWTKQRTACRGIVFDGTRILLSYEEKTDLYMLPGGGREGEESFDACCRREIEEETGVLVSVGKHLLTVHEYYAEWRYETLFFICKATGKGEQKLTDWEQAVGMVSKWVALDDAISIFSEHASYAEVNEEKRGIYFRAYQALLEFGKMHERFYTEKGCVFPGKD